MAKIIINVELNNKINAEIEKIKTSLQGIQVPKTSLANTAQLQKSYANLFNTIKNSKGAYPEDVFKGVAEKVEENLNAIKKLNASFETNGKLTKEQKDEYSQLKKALNQLSASFATTRAQTEKLEKTNKLAIPSVDNLRKRYADLLNTIKNTSQYYQKGTFDEITAKAEDYLTELKGLDNTSGDYAERVNELDKNLNVLSADFAETKKSATNFHGSLRDITSGFLKFQLAAMLVMKPLQLIRDAWASINETLVETEKKVVDLQRVVGKAANANDLYNLAEKYGQTFANASDIALNFARTGMNWTETIKATEAALLALNVAELDVTQASDGLIAIMQQFGYEASELTSIIDVLNKTSDNYAVTTEKLLTALQRTGSSAKNANLSLQETVGIVTALSEATGRSGENIGTAVNSLIQFSTKSSALDTFAKLSSNMATLVEDFRHGKGTVLDIWQGLSAEIQNASGSNESILSGLFGDEDWRSLNEELQEALGDNFAKVTEIYDTASTFRKNYFIALLNNMDTVESAIETASDAAGYSAKENEKYLDTYEAKLNTLQAQWQHLANDEQGFLAFKKGLVDIGSTILTIIEYTGGLRTTAIALGTTLTVVFGGKALTALKTFIATLKAGSVAFSAFNVWALGIGAALTAISLVVGVVQKANEAEKERQRLLDESYQENKDYAKSLRELYNEYSNLKDIENRTVEQNKTLEETEKSLIATLKEKHKILYDINEESLRALVYADLAENSSNQKQALEYRENNLKYVAKKQQKNRTIGLSGDDILEDNREFLKDYGINYKSSINSQTGKFYIELTDLSKGTDVEDAFANYAILNQIAEAFRTEAGKRFAEGDIEGSSELLESNFYQSIQAMIEEYGTIPYDTLQTTVEKYVTDNIAQLEKLTNEELIKKRDEYIEELGMHDFYSDTLEEIFNQVAGIKEEVVETEEATSKLSNDLSDVTDKYDKIVEKLKALRDANKESLSYEEKKKAVLEAEQALLDAQNERTVRVWNAQTNQWEYQTNESNIADAKEQLENARLAVEEAAYDSIIEEIETGNTTNSKILEIIEKWAVAYSTGDFSSISSNILNTIEEESGVHIEPPTYDSGGILTGLGGIKGTTQNEMVLSPELTAKFLEPVSNARFKAFADSLGLLFGASTNVASMNGKTVSNYGGATNNYNNSKYYTVNGLSIPNQIAEQYTLAEIFEMAAFIKD